MRRKSEHYVNGHVSIAPFSFRGMKLCQMIKIFFKKMPLLQQSNENSHSQRNYYRYKCCYRTIRTIRTSIFFPRIDTVDPTLNCLLSGQCVTDILVEMLNAWRG
jgi:hypothetical protein